MTSCFNWECLSTNRLSVLFTCLAILSYLAAGSVNWPRTQRSCLHLNNNFIILGSVGIKCQCQHPHIPPLPIGPSRETLVTQCRRPPVRHQHIPHSITSL